MVIGDFAEDTQAEVMKTTFKNAATERYPIWVTFWGHVFGSMLFEMTGFASGSVDMAECTPYGVFVGLPNNLA